MSHIEFFNNMVEKANDHSYRDSKQLFMLASIAESLAAIADILETREIDSEEE